MNSVSIIELLIHLLEDQESISISCQFEEVKA